MSFKRTSARNLLPKAKFVFSHPMSRLSACLSYLESLRPAISLGPISLTQLKPPFSRKNSLYVCMKLQVVVIWYKAGAAAAAGLNDIVPAIKSCAEH